MPYVSVEHQANVWVDAHIEKQWKHEGRWRLGCYYFVDSLQYYRVFDADQVRPVTSAEHEGDPERDAAPRHRKPDPPHEAACSRPGSRTRAAGAGWATNEKRTP